ncbi:MAG: PD-(D/E)XK nuclease family protein [Candidatus Ranarchaeia archaeon]|jgi:hypothetical protein
MDSLILTRIFRHGPITYSFQWNIRHHLNHRDTKDGEMLWKGLSEVYKGNIPEKYFSKASGFNRASRLRLKKKRKRSRNEIVEQLKAESFIKTHKQLPIIQTSQETNDHSHPAVLSKILRRDPLSISIETPVWSTTQQLTGHIDLIRLSGNTLEIIDYKPRGDFYSSIPQIATYGQVAHEVFGVPLKRIKCLAFNQNMAWEFTPNILSKLPDFRFPATT